MHWADAGGGFREVIGEKHNVKKKGERFIEKKKKKPERKKERKGERVKIVVGTRGAYNRDR